MDPRAHGLCTSMTLARSSVVEIVYTPYILNGHNQRLSLGNFVAPDGESKQFGGNISAKKYKCQKFKKGRQAEKRSIKGELKSPTTSYTPSHPISSPFVCARKSV